MSGYSGGSSGNTEEYLNALHACYEELSYSEIRDEALDNSIAINMLKAGKNEFDAAIKCSYQSTKNAKKDFLILSAIINLLYMDWENREKRRWLYVTGIK